MSRSEIRWPPLGRRQLLWATLPVLLPACALFKGKLQAPEVTLQSVKPGALGADGQEFICRLRLENPNDQDLRVVGGEVTVDRGTVVEGFLLPALGSVETDLKVTLDLLGGIAGVLRLLAAGSPDLDYTLKGFVDLDVRALGRIPLRSTGKVSMDRLLRQLPGLLRTPRDKPQA
jgi:LEA14-like dessication related protein